MIIIPPPPLTHSGVTRRQAHFVRDEIRRGNLTILLTEQVIHESALVVEDAELYPVWMSQNVATFIVHKVFAGRLDSITIKTYRVAICGDRYVSGPVGYEIAPDPKRED